MQTTFDKQNNIMTNMDKLAIKRPVAPIFVLGKGALPLAGIHHASVNRPPFSA